MTKKMGKFNRLNITFSFVVDRKNNLTNLRILFKRWIIIIWMSNMQANGQAGVLKKIRRKKPTNVCTLFRKKEMFFRFFFHSCHAVCFVFVVFVNENTKKNLKKVRLKFFTNQSNERSRIFHFHVERNAPFTAFACTGEWARWR